MTACSATTTVVACRPGDPDPSGVTLRCTLDDGHPGPHRDHDGAYWAPVETPSQNQVEPKVWLDRPDVRALLAEAKVLYARLRQGALATDLDADPGDWPEWDGLSRRDQTTLLALAVPPSMASGRGLSALRAMGEPPAEPTRGRDVSMPLTEVRTVLSRAEYALRNLRDYAEDPEPDALVSHYGEGYRKSDPDLDEMVAALGEVVAALARWRKTGRPRKKERP